MNRIWLISEVFYPDETASSHYMTWIARGLAQQFEVGAICATPATSYGVTRDRQGIERYEGVYIYRTTVPTLSSNRFVTRALRAALSSLSLLVMAWRRIGRGEAVLVISNPPFLPGLVALMCKLKRAKCVLRIDDVYPEAMVAAGVLSSTNPIVGAARAFFRGFYPFADQIVVLGRDMREVIVTRQPALLKKIEIIPNWADLDSVMPAAKVHNELLRSLGLTYHFVVLVAGNIGRVQGINTIVEAATLVKNEGIHFLLVGSGARDTWVKQVIKERGLHNVTLAGPRPREEQAVFLNACDVALLTLKEQMYGIGVPSRLYNYMAAGKPVIAVVDDMSEPALTIREHAFGWVVPPGDAAGLADVLRNAKAVGATRLQDLGNRARAIAETRYSREAIIAQYMALMNKIMSVPGGVIITRRSNG